MKSELQCECCGDHLQGDFVGNVGCVNADCLLHEKNYSHDFLLGRKIARENGQPVQQKERMAQGWANSETNECEDTPSTPEYDDTGMVVDAIVSFEEVSGRVAHGTITAVMEHHVKVDYWRTIPKWYVKLVA